jgi:hypothetical protein
MRIIAATFLLISLAFGSYGQKNDLKSEGLKGKVKSITTRGFKAVAGIQGTVLKGSLVHTSIKKYNYDGYLLESTSSIGGNTVGGIQLPYRSAKIIYKYDNQHNLISSCSYDTYGKLQDSSVHFVDKMGNRVYWQIYKGNGYQEWEYISEYDNSGNLLETNDFYRSKLLTRHMFKYNDQSKCTMENELNPDGTLKLKKLFTYDDAGNRIEALEFKGNGSFSIRHTYLYNAMGLPVEEREYLVDGVEVYSKILTDYDAEGNVIELKQYNDKGRMIYQGKLDKYGNHLSDIGYNPDGTIHDKITAQYKYDEFGNETEELLYFSQGAYGVKSTYKYVYDMDGNWSKKTVWEDGEPIRIAERDIDYY